MNLIDHWQELTRGLEQHCFIIITLKESNKWQNQKETKDRIFNTLISFRNSLSLAFGLFVGPVMSMPSSANFTKLYT